VPTLSENDPEPTGGSGPAAWLIALIVVIVLVAVTLHLTGVVGPG
jgi:hypothetical protein